MLSQIHFPFFSFAFMSYKNSETKKLRKELFFHLQLLKYISRFSEYVIKSFVLLIARCSEFLNILVFTGLKLKKEIKVFLNLLNSTFPFSFVSVRVKKYIYIQNNRNLRF